MSGDQNCNHSQARPTESAKRQKLQHTLVDMWMKSPNFVSTSDTATTSTAITLLLTVQVQTA